MIADILVSKAKELISPSAIEEALWIMSPSYKDSKEYGVDW